MTLQIINLLGDVFTMYLEKMVEFELLLREYYDNYLLHVVFLMTPESRSKSPQNSEKNVLEFDFVS